MRAQVTLHSIGDAFITTDASGSVQYLNPMAEQLTGWSSAEAAGKPVGCMFDVIHDPQRTTVEGSVAQCLREGSIVALGKAFIATSIPPEKICFEITETAAITNVTSATRFITALKEIGCQFALDDFGSGLSSFAYLKNFTVDFLKIDGAFVKDLVNDPIDLAMVKSINEIGHVMGIKTIAEFVENAAILKKLSEIGVDYVQGHGIGKPHRLDDL